FRRSRKPVGSRSMMMTTRTGHDFSSDGQQHSGFRGRTTVQTIKDFVTFPIRAVTLFDVDKWGLTALSSERFYYVSREVLGYCLDVGCGKNNRFIERFLNGNGRGIDVFRYEGLTEEHLVEDITQFPFADCSFD